MCTDAIPAWDEVFTPYIRRSLVRWTGLPKSLARTRWRCIPYRERMLLLWAAREFRQQYNMVAICVDDDMSLDT